MRDELHVFGIVGFLLCMIAASWQQGGLPIMGSTAGSSGGGGPTIVKTGGTGTVIATCTTATTTCALTYSPSSTGDWLIVAIPYASAHAPTTVTDNSGSTYSQITGTSSVNSGNELLTLFCTTSLAAGVTTVTSNGGGIGVMVIEGTGGSAPCTLDKSNTTANLTSTTSWSSGATAATTNAIDVAVGFAFDTTTQNPAWAGTNGYTALTANFQAASGLGYSVCYKSLSATGAQTATGTVGGTDTIQTAIWVLE